MSVILQVDIIECTKGYQAEISINSMWTAYTKVLPTKENCKEQVIKFAKNYNNADYNFTNEESKL